MARKGHFYGWIALGGAILVYFTGCSLFYSYGVFLPFICETTGWSRGVVGGGQSVFYVLYGIFSLPAGFLVGKFGPRKSIIVGTLVMAVGLVSLSQTGEVWQLYLFFGLIVGAGFAFGMFIPTTTIATNWFVTKRPLAFSFLVTSGGIGGLAMPPIIAELITVTSWRISWIFLAVLLLLLNLGIAVPFLLRDKPEDVGQHPDGATDLIGEQNLVNKSSHRAGKWEIITEAMHGAAFWHIIVFCTAVMFALQTMVTHQVAYLKDLGYSPVIASTTLGLIPGISIAGRFSYGFLARWFKAEWLTITFLGSMLLGLAIFVHATSFPAIVIYTVLFGFGYGALIVARTDLIAQYYGQEIYPELQGLIFPLQNTIAAAAPWIAGTIYDVTGTYTLAFMIVIGLLILGLISGFLLRPPGSKKGSARPV